MYNCTTATTAACAAGGGGLATTGLNIVWLLLAAFALLGAGMAVMRLVPRREA
jgi:hypothetical protein